MKIIWSPKARQDLNYIVEIIARDKKTVSLRWAQTVYKKVSRLQRFPSSGRIVPELNRAEIREILVGSYRIVYKVSSQISILTLFHGARKMRSL